MTILMALSTHVVRCTHASLHVNYVKPYENVTCPSVSCMTFETYTKSSEIYIVSDATFVFLPGEHYYDGNLKLSNVTDIIFQGEGLENSAQIIFTPGSNLTFIWSNNIILSNLSITLSGSQLKLKFFFSIDFRNTSATLLNLAITGSKNDYFSTAFRCWSSYIKIINIQTGNTKSLGGSALGVINSTIKLSGSNIFSYNLAYQYGGAFYSSDHSTISFSGKNLFLGNYAGISGGAIYLTSNTKLKISGTAYFLRNRAKYGNGGAIGLLNNCAFSLESDGNLYFIKNSAELFGGAIFMRISNAHIQGQMIFQNNTATAGAFGISTFCKVMCNGKMLFINNSAERGGAISLTVGSQMTLSGAKFENNYALLAGGALLSAFNSCVSIQGSMFVKNRVVGFGGAIDLQVNSVLKLLGDNYIEHNVAEQVGGGISASLMSKIFFTGQNYLINNTAGTLGGAFSTTFVNVTVLGTLILFNNTGHLGGAVYGLSSKIEFDTHSYVMFESNMATLQGGAIYSIDSIWSSKGDLAIFQNNFAAVGGAMSLTGSSKLILHKYSQTVYSQNSAKRNGGAIYFADKISINQCGVSDNTILSLCFQPNTTVMETCKRQDDCFIELDTDFPFNHSTSNISLIFQDNYAGKSGAVIFGGSLDNCRLYLGGGFQDNCGNKIGREYKESALQTLLQISTIDNNVSSAISSEPFRVCFCDGNGVPDCEKNISVNNIVRGEIFTLSAVTVGQVNFTVPSSIKADFGNSSSTTLNRLQRVQDTGNTCTNISYRLFSAEKFITMILFPDGPCRDTGIARREVNITFLPCPDGFILVDTECKCDRRLNPFSVSCNVDTRTIRREENNFWMMAIYDNSSYQGLLLHNSRCPFDFCVETAVEVNLKNSDIQCNHNHSGILCGSCRDNFSFALGSLHCLPCSNVYLSLIPALALAGITLVVFLLLLQLTVAYGTINGLVFYANVVQANRDIFFPPGDTNVLTVFIAWLNLDLGIETCFYDGMNAYAFIWLQFVFPFYVWFLIGFIIFLSHYSLRISKLLGDNPVSVLATLFLLSYSKILRTIIAALSRTTLQYPNDGTYQYVWLYDGSVPYLQRVDHILLGVFAIFSLLFLFLPYTILLLTGHWLQAYSDSKVFSWINKLKPFMDTYHGPFKKESRYWTGFLLLVRCILFLIFAFNTLGNATINLLTIISVCVGLMALAWLQNRLYMEIYNDVLEASFILNLCIFAAATYHVRETKENQDKLAYTSVGIAFAIFVCIVLYHIFRRTPLFKRDFSKLPREIFHSMKSKLNFKRNNEIVQRPLIPVPVTIIELDECDCTLEYTS